MGTFMKQRQGFVDAFWLKLLMAALMLLDHLYYNLLPQELLWAHYAARVVAPVFVWLMCEGMRHTRSRSRYIRRMLGFGLVMLAGNALLYALFGRWIDNSILLSLAIGAGVIACIDRAREPGVQRGPWVLAVILLLVLSLFFEGAYMVPLMAVIFYYGKDRPLQMWGMYFVVFCLPYLLLWPSTGRLDPQFFMIFAILPIACYNGQRGRNGPFARYFFYVFYPLHIWIIFLLEQALIFGI